MTDLKAEIRKELEELVEEGKRVRVQLLAEADPTSFEQLQDSITGLLLGRPHPPLVRRSKSKARAPEARRRETEQLRKQIEGDSFGALYQNWYSRALPAVRQLLPDRYEEFCELHRLSKRAQHMDASTYTISDFIQGILVKDELGAMFFDAGGIAGTKMQGQLDILSSALGRLDSLLSDITGSVEAGLLDDEIVSAKELAKARFRRSAGIVAGVVLERHLKRVVANHKVKYTKTPQIGTLNDTLKEAKVYDVPTWRLIQRLGDLRNLCGHDNEREPTRDEVNELLSGVEKVTTTVF